MRKALFLPLIFLFIAIQSSSGQRASIGLNILDFPFEIYGGSIRVEPEKSFYLEVFGSYRPLVERKTGLFCNRTREGTVFDASLGFQKTWPKDKFTISVGPYLQTKNLRGEKRIPTGFLACNTNNPERLDITVTGLRLGMSFTFSGFYLQGYGGVGFSNRPSLDEVHRVLMQEGISIAQEEYYAHARLILGWQFDLRRKSGE